MAAETIETTAAHASAAPLSSTSSSTQHNGAAQPTQKRHEEYQYLDLVREILDHGEHRPDR